MYELAIYINRDFVLKGCNFTKKIYVHLKKMVRLPMSCYCIETLGDSNIVKGDAETSLMIFM